MGRPLSRGDNPEPDIEPGIEVRLVHPYRARKEYRCPGCGHPIRPGTGHYVVIPVGAADLRRHWHRPCWERHVPPARYG